MSWTDERVELLKKLWTEGLSASQIAAELGGGVTRNAVIGKVHRLNLAGRAKPAGNSVPRVRRQRAAAPGLPRAPRPLVVGNTNNTLNAIAAICSGQGCWQAGRISIVPYVVRNRALFQT